MELRLEPNISSCIETVAKKEYERVLSILLKGEKDNRRLEEKLELLRIFLESADFRDLRGRSEKIMSKGRRVEFILRSVNNETILRN